jgi:hypothetical protein
MLSQILFSKWFIVTAQLLAVQPDSAAEDMDFVVQQLVNPVNLNYARTRTVSLRKLKMNVMTKRL